MSPQRTIATFRRIIFLVSTALFFNLIASFTAFPIAAQSNQRIFLPLIATSPTPFIHSINRLPNPSFEGGWYHPGNIPELQIPDEWTFTWETGPTGFGNEPWDVWVRPEVRVLPSIQLPPHEHPLFIWDGDQTVKIFKGYGCISFQMRTTVWLEPGKYVLEMSVFPDLVVDYDDEGNKIWAPDPLSGEVKLGSNNNLTDWILPTFGQKNSYYYVFIVSQAQNVPIQVAMRGRYAIRNNGWFMDDWWLWQQNDLALPPGVYTTNGQPAFLAADYIPPLEPPFFPVGNPAHDTDE